MSGDQSATPAPSAFAIDRPDGERATATWRSAWQIPTILMSVGLIVLGLRSATMPVIDDDFVGALAQVEELIESGQIGVAYAQMRATIEPSIGRATPEQRALFHALSADLTYASQARDGTRNEATYRHIATQYAAAEQLGMALDAVRQERWGEALIALNEIGEVEARLSAIELLKERPPIDDEPNSAAKGGMEGARGQVTGQAHARLFRKMIDAMLLSPDFDATRMMEILTAYRLNPAVSEWQRMWAATRLAKLRLETGAPELAISNLLVEMRRVESEAPRDQSAFGALYVLLGQAYLALDETENARAAIDAALSMLAASDPARGDALVLLGRLALATGDQDLALECFNTVVDDFVGTSSHLPGLLGRAEVQSAMGDHDAAIADFCGVADALGQGHIRRDMSRLMISERLCDRHDAATALRMLERAINYAEIAESMFEGDAVPAAVLIRLASSNQQMAENLLASVADVQAEVDPVLRLEVNALLVRAGEYYLRHVNAQTQRPLSDEDWGASLWAAADCFDRAGQQKRAVAEFEKYLGSRAVDDARRAECMFRIAQAHHALQDHAEAAQWYERVLADRARSSFAARCHVLLAKCYFALNRTDEACATLQAVVAGQTWLDPDASDYRDALLALARMHHALGQYVEAIERFAETIARYPGDARSPELQYFLADSYRGAAIDIAERLHDEPGLATDEAIRLSAARVEYLQMAERLFGELCAEGARAEVDIGVRRKAALYQADCAFELGQFDHAVHLYEAWSRDDASGAASMYALVQIVNCYTATGDVDRAKAAHQRALLRLKQLPESVFASPNSLMDRAAWERWLRNSPAGAMATAESGADTG